MSDTGTAPPQGCWVWRKSSFSEANGNSECVEVGSWRTSSYSEANGNSDCVQVNSGPAVVGLRDSKNLNGPKLIFDQPRWLTFVTKVTATIS